MLLKFRAVLIRKVRYGEKSLILQTFTREEGTKSFFLQSRSGKKNGKIALPTLGLLEIVASAGKGSMLNVREIKSARNFFNTANDMTKASVAMFLNEVFQKTILNYQKDENIFDFVEQTLDRLEEMPVYQPDFHLKTLIRFSSKLGFGPTEMSVESKGYFDLYEGVFTQVEPLHGNAIPPALSAKFSKLLGSNAGSEIKLSRDERRLLLAYVLDFYKIHIDQFNELKSTEVLEEIFS